jgi:plastocyanin
MTGMSPNHLHRGQPRRGVAQAALSILRAGLPLALLAGTLAVPGAAESGVIRGRLLTTSAKTRPPSGDPSADKSGDKSGGKQNDRPGRNQKDTSPLEVQRGASDAVIYLVKVPDKVEKKLTKRGWFAKKPALARVVQERRAFVPRVLVTTVGSSVEFANLDRVYHNVFSVSAAKRFDLGKYPPGHADTVTFENAGVANLHCDIHPDESAFVVVVPNHAFVRPDSLGRYKLPKLPPGDYALRVWHSRLGEIRRDVVMPRRGDVDLDLRF